MYLLQGEEVKKKEEEGWGEEKMMWMMKGERWWNVAKEKVYPLIGWLPPLPTRGRHKQRRPMGFSGSACWGQSAARRALVGLCKRGSSRKQDYYCLR